MRQAAVVEIIVSAIELCVAGVATSVSSWQLFNKQAFKVDEVYAEDHTNVFAGQHCPTASVVLALISSHVYGVYLAVYTAVMTLEGAKLEFDSVRHATCSSSADKERINKYLEKEYETVDKAIKRLKAVGRYTKDVEFNLNHGMCLRSAREGINPCKVL